MRDVNCRVLVDAGYEAVEAAYGAVGLHLWHARGADPGAADDRREGV